MTRFMETPLSTKEQTRHNAAEESERLPSQERRRADSSLMLGREALLKTPEPFTAFHGPIAKRWDAQQLEENPALDRPGNEEHQTVFIFPGH